MPDFLINIVSQGGDNPFSVFWFIFTSGGWIAVDVAMLYVLWWAYFDLIQLRYDRTVKHVLLAIDVPKENEQSFKAVEQIFATLSGAHKDPNLTEIYLEGEFQLNFSFEIVSIDGYIQYMVRTPKRFRNLIESAIFAQYPDAEITEIEDYAMKLPDDVPNEEWDLYGGEFIQTGSQYYPIRTWTEFEDKATQTTADPMASLLEIMASLPPGEQIWFQIVVTPVSHKWKDKGDKLVKKLIGAKAETEYNAFERVLYGTLNTLGFIGEQTIGYGPASPEEKSDAPRSQMLFLSPGEGAVVEALEKKLAKIGFKCRLRALYIGRRETFSKKRIVSPIIGAIKQFNTHNLGGLKPDGTVSTNKAEYFFKRYRTWLKQVRIYKAYRGRSTWIGAAGGWGILNIEELATLWHFPLINVKAPSLAKSLVRTTEPPTRLPITPPGAERTARGIQSNPLGGQALRKQPGEAGPAGPPTNLPIG